MGEVRNVLLVLGIRVMAFTSHWVVIVAMKSSMVVRAVVEVLRIVEHIVVAMFKLIIISMMRV